MSTVLAAIFLIWSVRAADAEACLERRARITFTAAESTTAATSSRTIPSRMGGASSTLMKEKVIAGDF